MPKHDERSPVMLAHAPIPASDTASGSASMTFQENTSLASFTTLGIGGPARYFCRVTSEPELLEAVRFARKRNLPIFVLGGGSNLLVADAGFPGLVLHLAIAGAINIDGLRDDLPNRRTVTYDIPGGFDWNAFVRITCEAGFTGVESLAGIPGYVGASPVQNIGAYGQEVSQTIAWVRALDLETLEFRSLPAEACGFAYRTSIFNSTQRGRYIITRVAFTFHLDAEPRLTYADLQRHFAGQPKPKPLDIYHAVRAIRGRKGMVIDPAHPHPDTRSAGSFFKNPLVPASIFASITHSSPNPVPHWASASGEIKLAAAWLIEQSGFPRGFSLGPVGISTRHTLALVNRTGTASCADLLFLRDTVIAEVKARFGVTLEQEPVYVT